MSEHRQTAGGAALGITRLGARGDGIAETPAGPVYVPFSLPGETWRLAPDGTFEAIETLGAPARVEPACAHFATCGGCVAQHMPTGTYAVWKREIVVEALGQHGIRDASVAPLVTSGPGTRRRTVLAARRARGGAAGDGALGLGYHERASDRLVAIAMCPVLVPAIASRIEGLRAILALALSAGSDARVTCVAANEGLDVDIGAESDAALRPRDAKLRAALARTAGENGIVRLIVAGEEIVQAVPPSLTLGRIEVPLPPSVFLQASAAAEGELTARVVAGVGTAKSVADLFSGIGTFAAALCERVRVSAFDSDAAALAALEAGLKKATGMKPVEAVRRDLFREPLSRRELEAFDAVVFDPPRAGARAQAEMLAKSDVATVVAVSCNPGTFARDARILIDGGYEIGTVTPVDQFVFSEHVELVAVFKRAARKRARGVGDRLRRR